MKVDVCFFLPCPFCGGPTNTYEFKGILWVECLECMVRMPGNRGETVFELRNRWNTRQIVAIPKENWTFPDVKCKECGEQGRPILIVDTDGSWPGVGCSCGELDGEGIVVDWPFEGQATFDDFRALGFMVV